VLVDCCQTFVQWHTYHDGWIFSWSGNFTMKLKAKVATDIVITPSMMKILGMS
jgi:hypothetical protein